MLSNHDDLFGDFADQFYGYGNYAGRCSHFPHNQPIIGYMPTIHASHN